jgi:hypothetical protein
VPDLEVVIITIQITMKKEHNSQEPQKQALNIPVVVRWLIILGSCILIALIWLLIIPWSILITLPTGRFMHEFDCVMQPYYWFDMAWNNERV